MQEFIQSCFQMPVLPATILVLLVMAYWLLAIVGILGIDMFDFDLFDEGTQPGTQNDSRPGLFTPLCSNCRDGFGNLVTVHAVANPAPAGRQPATLHDTMPGYGIVRFDTAKGEVTFQCWPRHGGPQYEGWPRTIRLMVNHCTAPRARNNRSRLRPK